MALVQVKCPRCGTRFNGKAQQDGSLLCPGCGARLKRRASPPAAPPLRAPDGPEAGAPPAPPEAPASAPQPESVPPLPESATPFREPPPPPFPEPTAPPLAEPAAATAGRSSVPAFASPVSRDAAAPPPAANGDSALPGGADEDPSASSLRELVLSLHRSQQRILEILERQFPAAAAEAPPPPPPPQAGDDDITAFPPAPTRARRRKTVLLVDDDDETRQAAQQALEEAEVPVRTADSGEQALALFAEQSPDVLVLEGELGGEIDGRDLVDRIRATTEWIDVPIILYTRARLGSQDEARTTYSSDDYVLKGPQGPVALVSQVIATFRST